VSETFHLMTALSIIWQETIELLDNNFDYGSRQGQDNLDQKGEAFYL